MAMPTAPIDAGPCARSPRQARGHRRVDGILDAAESIVAEAGPTNASVHEIARRAGASVGSIYHFFPTKDAIIAALVERYAERLRAVAACVADGAAARADGPLCEFVVGIVDPFADFIARHPAYLVLSRMEGSGAARVSPGAGRALRDALVAALARRFPGASAEESSFRASMVEALGEGVLALMARSPSAERERLIGEFRRALAAYLASLEIVPPQAGPA
jgi:AcrR family transcriptional regulator